MALAFDVANSGSALPGSSVTISHTVTNSLSNPILFVGICQDGSGTDDVTGVTYNGVSMTRIATKEGNAINNRTYLYVLVNPATGAAHNVVVSMNNSGDFVRAFSVSYTGAAQTGQPDNSATAVATAASITNAITTVADNCWVITVANDSSSAALAAGTNVTQRSGLGSLSAIGDSNGVVHPAGSFSQTWNGTGTDDLTMIQASIAPFVVNTYRSKTLPILGVG